MTLNSKGRYSLHTVDLWSADLRVAQTPSPIDLWIAALESGVYKQGLMALRRGDAYSAVGVLCDVYRLHANDPDPEAQWSDVGGQPYRFLRSRFMTPPRVFNWVRMKQGARCKWSSFDDPRRTFAETASYLRLHKELGCFAGVGAGEDAADAVWIGKGEDDSPTLTWDEPSRAGGERREV